jgi:50S ribosomal subunit-associated GTPase HflX
MECKYGCIFYNNRLHGDCRMPESKECAMNQQVETANEIIAEIIAEEKSKECAMNKKDNEPYDFNKVRKERNRSYCEDYTEEEMGQ